MTIWRAPAAPFRVAAALSIAVVLALGIADQALAQSSAPSGPEADTQSKPKPMTEEEYQQKLKALHWVDGPKDLPALGNATLNLPDHYVFLDDADTKKF